MKHKTDVSNLKRRLVEGIQVITGEGVLSGSGHLSARIPGTETFFINPRFAGVLADPKDICTVTFDGKRIAGKGPIPSETPIHAAVYRSRPEVGSVLHCHARYSILVGLLDSGLIPFNREARLFADGVPIFPESRGIDDFTLAQRMVDALGGHYAIFLRGHGVVVAGPGIEGTCISAIQLERACQDQILDRGGHAVQHTEWPSPCQCAAGKSLPRLAVSFVQAQSKIESSDPRRHPRAERGRALLTYRDARGHAKFILTMTMSW